MHNGQIYDATSSRGKLSDLQLLIKYEGDIEPIWQQCTSNTKLTHATLVHDYLRNHKLARFIPAQYKRIRDHT